MTPEFPSQARNNTRNVTVRRTMLASGATIAVIMAVGGVTWANTDPQSAAAHPSTPTADTDGAGPTGTRPNAADISPMTDGRRVDIFGPKGLPADPVTVATGGELVVHLQEQAGSTEYSWSPTDVPDSLALTGESSVTGPTMPGSVGEHIFTFRVNGDGQGTLSFSLVRPREKKPANKISITVNARRQRTPPPPTSMIMHAADA